MLLHVQLIKKITISRLYILYNVYTYLFKKAIQLLVSFTICSYCISNKSNTLITI